MIQQIFGDKLTERSTNMLWRLDTKPQSRQSPREANFQIRWVGSPPALATASRVRPVRPPRSSGLPCHRPTASPPPSPSAQPLTTIVTMARAPPQQCLFYLHGSPWPLHPISSERTVGVHIDSNRCSPPCQGPSIRRSTRGARHRPRRRRPDQRPLPGRHAMVDDLRPSSAPSSAATRTSASSPAAALHFEYADG